MKSFIKYLNEIKVTKEQERGDEISKPAANDPEVLRHPESKDHFYTRKIGDHVHTKVLLGTVGKTIK